MILLWCDPLVSNHPEPHTVISITPSYSPVYVSRQVDGPRLELYGVIHPVSRMVILGEFSNVTAPMCCCCVNVAVLRPLLWTR